MPYWGLTLGLWILLTLVLWAYGQNFFVAMLFGAIPSMILDGVLTLACGAWGVGDGVRWLFRQLRPKR